MYLEEKIKKICDIDINREEYRQFDQAAKEVDWRNSKSGVPSYTFLTYAQGITFPLPNYIINSFPKADRWTWTEAQKKNTQLLNLLSKTEPMYAYIEELLPGYKVIKGEIMTTIPEFSVPPIIQLARVHIDAKIMHSKCRRIHISIQNNQNSFLIIENVPYHIPVGTIYEFNNKIPHWGINIGDKLRISFVVDLLRPEEWESMSENDKISFYERDTTRTDEEKILLKKSKIALMTQ